jgi:hypothetical protein
MTMNEQGKAPTPPKPIKCDQRRRLLARMDAEGIYLWCAGCHCEHHFLFASFPDHAAHWQEVQQHLLTT